MTKHEMAEQLFVQRVANQGWGDSVFTRVYEVLRDYNMSWSGVCNMLPKGETDRAGPL